MVGLTTITLGSFALSGLMAVLFAATSLFWLAVTAMAAAGFSMVVCGTGTQTLIQTAVAGHMRGRVLSIWGLVFRGGPAVGTLIMGWLSGFFGLAWPLAVGGALCALAAGFMLSRRGQLVRLLEDRAPVRPVERASETG